MVTSSLPPLPGQQAAAAKKASMLNLVGKRRDSGDPLALAGKKPSPYAAPVGARRKSLEAMNAEPTTPRKPPARLPSNLPPVGAQTARRPSQSDMHATDKTVAAPLTSRPLPKVGSTGHMPTPPPEKKRNGGGKSRRKRAGAAAEDDVAEASMSRTSIDQWPMELSTRVDAAALAAAEKAFRAEHPEYTGAIDALRAKEYARLDTQGHAYVDYASGSLYAERQLREHHAMMSSLVLGNPSSANPASAAAAGGVDAARRAVLQHFRADDATYDVVFAPDAAKFVGETYPFSADATFLGVSDNDCAVGAIQAFARRAGAAVETARLRAADLRIAPVELNSKLTAAPAQGATRRLFAFPALSNYSGVIHSLDWVARAQKHGWDVLLDAAAFAPMHALDLSTVQPEFVTVSFHKIFGYPTGVSAVIVKKTALAKLQREGTALVDSTVNYLAVPAVTIGLKFVNTVGLDTIRTRCAALTAWTVARLLELKHSNGNHIVDLFGPHDTTDRGAAIAFALGDPNGKHYHASDVEQVANSHMVSLCSGCFCNADGGAASFGIGRQRSLASTATKAGDPEGAHDELLDAVDFSGAVRVSYGIASNFADAFRLVAMLEELCDAPASAVACPRNHQNAVMW